MEVKIAVNRKLRYVSAGTLTLLLWWLGAVGSAHAAVYKCMVAGATVFSDKPCPSSPAGNRFAVDPFAMGWKFLGRDGGRQYYLYVGSKKLRPYGADASSQAVMINLSKSEPMDFYSSKTHRKEKFRSIRLEVQLQCGGDSYQVSRVGWYTKPMLEGDAVAERRFSDYIDRYSTGPAGLLPGRIAQEACEYMATPKYRYRAPQQEVYEQESYENGYYQEQYEGCDEEEGC